jgi:renal tumor antigen
MDIWGFGCVFFELLSLFPLFPGKHELDQIHKIHNVLGTPHKDII